MEHLLRHRDPIAPQLFRQLQLAIVEMRLTPGEAISEKEISLRYSVSRQPVREAFIKLSEAGLLEIRPSRGTYVRKISVREIADARFVREAVECSLVRHAAQLATQTDRLSLHTLIEEQEQAVKQDDFARFNQYDEVFHRSIGDIVQCDYALRTVERARNQIDRVRFLSLGAATPMTRLLAQHKDITSSIAAGDADRAEEAMRMHLREVMLALPQLAKANPDIFEDQTLPPHALDIAASHSS